jgi:hypothetical protein
MKGMANEEHLEKLREGVEAWNQWREKNPDLQPDLRGVDLREAQLKGANLSGAQLQGADLTEVQLQGAALNFAQLQGAGLSYAQLQGASLRHAQLQGADLSYANLSGADLGVANLSGADLSEAQLQGADLSGAFFDNATRFEKVILGDKKYGGASLVDVSWGGVNLAVVDWASIKMLGDDDQASRPTSIKWFWNANTTLERYRTAVRSNRQLAVALQTQGLNEDAARFAYRANVLQRKVLWYQLFLRPEPGGGKERLHALVWEWLVGVGESLSKLGSYVFSLFLGVLAGYGYRPGRTLGWYVLIVLSYAVVYFNLEHLTKLHLSFIGALIFSITAFHGRGFFPGGFGYDDLVTILAATEAVVELLIELSFIATFTQRFFGK